MIAKLKTKKIVWDQSYDDPNSQIFIVTVDGTDLKCWEEKHPTLLHNKYQFSHKFNHGAFKYEIAVDIYK
jgi:hypothetical protein